MTFPLSISTLTFANNPVQNHLEFRHIDFHFLLTRVNKSIKILGTTATHEIFPLLAVLPALPALRKVP